jgi:hypothetical protein
MIKRYAVDGSWVYCSNGIIWQKIKVSSQTTESMHGCLAATLNDRVGMNMGGCPQMIGAAALVAALSASFLVMAATVFAVAGIVLINYSICGLLTRPGMWSLVHKDVLHQKQNALMVEAQINCMLGGINTIINVGDMILFAKYAQFSYFRANDDKQDKTEYQKLLDEGINLQEVKREDLPIKLQNKDLWDNPKTGFHAKIFKDDSGRYVVAFRGTVTDDKDLRNKDIKVDAKQALHRETEQYNNAMQLSEEIDKEFPDDEVIFTGHSKGGGEAAAAGTITGRPTYTYNSAGLSGKTVSRYTDGAITLADSKHIIALNSNTDILSMAQDGKFFIAAAMSTIPVLGPLLAPHVIAIPQAAGKRTSLVTDETFNPLANHSLEPLIEAMEKKKENPQIDVIAKNL